MRILTSLLIGMAINPVASAMMLVNSEKVYPIPDDFVIDIDIDCDYNPDTDEVYNCKIVSKSDE